MRKSFSRFILTGICLFIITVSFAQKTDTSTLSDTQKTITNVASTIQAESTDTSGMRSEGKIYVVMAVCLTILIGLILYVVSIDRKIKKIEDAQ